MPIPSDFLYTMETKPILKVESKGILCGCEHFNCEYVQKEAQTPSVQSITEKIQ